MLKKKPSEYVSQIYFDALVFTPEALRHLVAQVGASQVVLGTDHPIPWEVFSCRPPPKPPAPPPPPPPRPPGTPPRLRPPA